MYDIRLEGDTRRMLRRIRSFSEIDKRSINAALGEIARESTLERFRRSMAPDGRRWRVSIRAANEGGKTLVKSSQLRNSIRARRAKALRFQVDGKWISKKQVRVTIPARPFLGLSEDDMQEMKATVEEFIARED